MSIAEDVGTGVKDSKEFLDEGDVVAPMPKKGAGSAAGGSGGMPSFTTLKGKAAALDLQNIDTDMIIPKQFLKTIKRTGLGVSAFYEMRYNEDGSERDDFVLNKPAYRDSILVAGDNFGCGSSREHAPWAIATSASAASSPPPSPTSSSTTASRTACSPQAPRGAGRGARGRGRGRRARGGPRRAGDQASGRLRDCVRRRSLPQKLPPQRPRRHRADPAEGGQDRSLRGDPIEGVPLVGRRRIRRRKAIAA